jgi:hypothetical protein
MEMNKGRDACFFEDCGTRKGNSCC